MSSHGYLPQSLSFDVCLLTFHVTFYSQGDWLLRSETKGIRNKLRRGDVGMEVGQGHKVTEPSGKLECLAWPVDHGRDWGRDLTLFCSQETWRLFSLYELRVRSNTQIALLFSSLPGPIYVCYFKPYSWSNLGSNFFLLRNISRAGEIAKWLRVCTPLLVQRAWVQFVTVHQIVRNITTGSLWLPLTTAPGDRGFQTPLVSLGIYTCSHIRTQRQEQHARAHTQTHTHACTCMYAHTCTWK